MGEADCSRHPVPRSHSRDRDTNPRPGPKKRKSCPGRRTADVLLLNIRGDYLPPTARSEMADESSKWTIQGLKEGNRAAQGAFYEQYAHRVFGLARRKLADRRRTRLECHRFRLMSTG